jgi:hypothetical protein
MNDEDLRDLFAFGILIAQTIRNGQVNAVDVYEAADLMIEAKYAEPEPEEGITAIKPKRKVK